MDLRPNDLLSGRGNSSGSNIDLEPMGGWSIAQVQLNGEIDDVKMQRGELTVVVSAPVLQGTEEENIGEKKMFEA